MGRAILPSGSKTNRPAESRIERLRRRVSQLFALDLGIDDVVISPDNVRLPASGAPSWTTFSVDSYDFQVLEFNGGGNEFVHFKLQLPHNRVPGTEVTFHVHFINNDATIANGETISWKLLYTYADVGDTYVSGSNKSTGTDMQYTHSGGTAPVGTHIKSAWATLDIADTFVSGIIMGVLTLADADTSYTSDLSMISVDAHIQIKKLGEYETP